MNLSFRNYYWRWLKNLIFLSLLSLIFLSIGRLFFAIYFGGFSNLFIHFSDLKKAMFLGVRFDLIPVSYINVIPFLLLNLGYFLPGKLTIKMIRFSSLLILSLGNFLLLWLLIFDYGFYSYFQDHLNVLFFGFFEDDTIALLTSIYKNYNIILWGSLLGAIHYAIYRFIKFLFSPFDFDIKARSFSWKMPLTFALGLVLLSFFGRGNFTRLPLSIEDAHISQNEFVNEIALNGALTLNRAIKIRKTFGKDNFDYIKKYGFKDWKEAFQEVFGEEPKSNEIHISLTKKTKENPFLKSNPPHVVVVVMESFGSYWNDSDSDKFQILGDLKNHFAKGILFKNFLPAENGTIGSIVSVATSQVIRPGARFLSESQFMKTSIDSSGHRPFSESGYETHFVYGGKLGWRNLGKFLKIQGYQKLWGADEIKEAMPELNHIPEEELGNEWGVFDEYLYTFIEEQLRTATKPQFFFVLTTSNHPPFEYPSSYQPRKMELTPEFLVGLTVNKELAMKRFLGIQYANQKMAEFLNRIHSSSLEENTILALTGDHSYWITKGVDQDQEFKRYAVPFFLSIPKNYRPLKHDPHKFGSHEDIFPTLYHLALSNQSYVKLGEDLFNDSSVAINSSGIVANEWGSFHNNKFWAWKDPHKQILTPVEVSAALTSLKRKGEGLIALTDAYLKSEKSRKQNSSKSDQQ